MIDVLVAGGGPAGLATALFARRAGLTAIIVEPRPAPRDKACGEGLMPAAVRTLAALGVQPAGRSFRGIRYLDDTTSSEARFRRGSGLGVRRTELHRALSEATAAAGIPIVSGTVDDLDQDDRAVTAAGITARYLVAADGLHSPIARRLGLAVPAGPVRRWGMRGHWAVAPWTDLVEVHWAEHAEAYVTPVGSDLIGVAVLTGRRGTLAEHLADFPRLTARLAGAQPGKVLGAGPLRHRTRRRVAGRVLLVGDAAGYVDALTGEGIAVALGCARALVASLAADQPQQYEASWRTASRRYRTLTHGLLWASGRPVLRRALVPAAARLPRVFGAIVDQLAR